MLGSIGLSALLTPFFFRASLIRIMVVTGHKV